MSDDLLEQYLAQVNAPAAAPQNCRSCRFYVEASGICRRRAPLADAREWAMWPITREDDWCGEWEARACRPA